MELYLVERPSGRMELVCSSTWPLAPKVLKLGEALSETPEGVLAVVSQLASKMVGIFPFD